MALLDRLIDGGESGKIPVHTFMAAVGEVRDGEATLAQLAAAFNLDAQEQAQLAELGTRLAADAFTADGVLHRVLILGEAGLYDKARIKTRLGLALG